MIICRSIEEVRQRLLPSRRAGARIGFVPTMGALHEGHLSLIRMARADSDLVVASVFVNPLQFAANEDLDRYPRDERRDLDLLQREGTDVAFLPAVDEMYPPGSRTRVTVGEIGTIVEGAIRPGHFDGVATVVVKLFDIVQPESAFFGQKDAQQVAVIKQVVRDLALPVEIGVGPTVREPDGLALSSRNVYLDAAEREASTSLWRALQAGAESLSETGDPSIAEKVMADIVVDGGLELDYALVVDPDTFDRPVDRHLLVVAARAGRTRLIDNLPVETTPPGGGGA